MNIFKVLNKSGKMALSALQAVGLTAVVGAAGIGAWQYLSGPADDNNAFNPAQYNPGEVVYVAGANTGSYGSSSYGHGDPGSSVQVSAQTLKRLDRQAMAERAAREMEEEASQIYSSEPGPSAYQMGATEGLGMGANYVSDSDSNSSPFGDMQQSTAGVQDMIAKAQQQIAGAAQGKKPADQGAAGGAASLGSVTPNWSRGGSGSGGAGGGSSFALQNSGKNKGRGSRGAATVDPQAALANAQAQAAGMLEGARIKGRSSFGNMETLGGNRNASIEKSGRSQQAKDDMEFFTKRSIDVAKNKHRSNTEANVFLASTQISGGMRIAAENVTTGQGQGSKDFTNDYEAQLRGIRAWGTGTGGIGDTELNRARERQRLMLTLWIVTPLVLMMIPWIGTFASIGYSLLSNPYTAVAGAGYLWAAGIMSAIALGGIATLEAFAGIYQSHWGGNGLSTASYIIGGVLAAGVGTAWIPAVGAWMGQLQLWLATTAPALLGTGAAWLATKYGDPTGGSSAGTSEAKE